MGLPGMGRKNATKSSKGKKGKKGKGGRGPTQAKMPAGFPGGFPGGSGGFPGGAGGFPGGMPTQLPPGTKLPDLSKLNLPKQ